MDTQFKDWLSMTSTAFAGMQKLAALNVETVRNLLETGFDPAQTLFSVRGFDDARALQDRFAKATLAWSRSACDIGSDTLDAMLEHAPAGPVCATIGIWKSAVGNVGATLRSNAV